MFNKTYELSLNKNYVSHWGLVEAVRELIQNALDSESPFKYEIVQCPDDTFSLILRSEFTTLSPQTLLLGSTSKSGSEDSIGSFGEGYKVALLVLTRIGNDVIIKNGDKLWLPKFKFNSKFGEDLLVITESALPERNTGLVFEVQGLFEDDVNDITEYCLQMQKHIGAIKTTQYGDILLEKPGKLYVGGLYICETELKYGYNIKPHHIKLERDRQTVSSFDLKWLTKMMWFETGEYGLVSELIADEVEDLSYAQYDSPPMVKEACYRLFRERHPGAIAAKTQAELDSLVERGMERVVILGGMWYANVTSAPEYCDETRIAVETVEERMRRWLSNNRSYMRKEAIVAFKELITEAALWRRK